MKLSLLFGLLCVLFVGIYATAFVVGMSNPVLLAGLSIVLLLSGWGAGIFFILAIVMLVLRR